MTPTRDLVLVRSQPITRDLKIGLIAIPQVGLVAPRHGTVLACGPRVQDVAVGDRVLFSKHAGSAVSPLSRLDNSRLLMLKESDCMAVLEL